jgi:hypothetical protein
MICMKSHLADGTALLNPGHVLAAADADRATFDADRGGAKLEEMSGIVYLWRAYDFWKAVLAGGGVDGRA